MIYLDYLTLTSYDSDVALWMPLTVKPLIPGTWKHATVMQYKGWRNKAVFFGTAVQNERRHFMLVVSGRDAHDLFPKIPHTLTHKMSCTRLDLQVTVPLPFAWNEDDIWERVQDGVGKTKYVNDSEKTWTVYVGSRRSRLFWRIYTKHYEKVYLRYEVELKRHHAHTVFRTIAKYGKSALIPVFLERLRKLKVSDKAKEPALELVLGLNGHDMAIELLREERKKSLESMCVWLDNLTIAFERRMGDHEVGHIMRNYIDDWYEMKDVLDGSGGCPGR